MISLRRGLLGLGLMLAALAVVALLVDVRAVWAQVQAARWPYLAPAALALLAGLAAFAARWRALLPAQVGWPAAFHAANLGHAVNVLVPLRAGEAVRLMALSRRCRLPLAQVAGTVVVERLFEQCLRLLAVGGALLAGTGLAVTPAVLFGGLGLVAALLAALLWVSRNTATVLAFGSRALARLPWLDEARARRALEPALGSLAGLADLAGLARVLGWSLLAWLCFLACYVFVVLALPAPLPPGAALALALGALALAPPSAAAAPGIYHAAVALPLGLAGFAEPVVGAFAVLAHALQMALMLALGAWALAQGFTPTPSPAQTSGPHSDPQ